MFARLGRFAIQSRDVNGFTAAQVDDALRGAVVGTAEYRTRVELLDSDNQVLREIENLLEGEVKHNNAASIKRTLSCKIRETNLTLDDYPDIIIADSPLVYWRLGDTSGTNANDETANNLDGTYTGSPTLNATSLLLGDTLNGSVTLNGSTQYVTRAHNAAFNTSALTVEAWIKTSQSGAYQIIAARDNETTNKSWQLRLTNVNVVEFVLWFTGSAMLFTTTVTIADGMPHHVVGTYDGAHVVVYVDSYRVLRTAETRTLDSATVALELGRVTVSGAFFNGSIDEFALYGRALSSAEVREHYQKGSAVLDEIDYTRDRLKPYIAIKMTANGTDGTPWAEFPLGIFLLSAPERNQTETGIDRPVQGFDQTTILMQDCVTARYVVSTTNYITAVSTLLTSAGLDTSGYQLTPTALVLPADRSWALGTPKLTIINDLLAAINYRPFRFNSSGVGIAEPYVLPESRAVDYSYTTDEFSVMMPDMSYSINMFDVPNVVVLSRSAPKTTTITATATNNKIASPTSVIRRGDISIVYADPNFDAADQTTITAAANRILTEKSQASQIWRFGTTIHPFHEDEDVLTLTNTSGLYFFGVADDFLETEWSLPFTDPTTAVMTHVAARIVPVV